ncbi:MAG: hypothetical protein GX144_00545 [Clostridiaceae bacterium]|jgi:uncharacterized membrane protein|nr:hypothetical protein [Clostridiaceae bacterium]
MATSPSDQKVMSVLSYLGILWLVPFLTEHKNDPLVKFHINQGVILTICWAGVWVISYILGFIPILGGIVSFLANIALIVLAIIGIVNAVNLREAELPVIGKYRIIK